MTTPDSKEKPVHQKTSKARKYARLAKGFTILEVMVAASILSISVLGVASFQNVIMTKTATNNDRAFAMEKAMQMFEELRTFVQGNKENGIQNLNNFSDGSNYNLVLTSTPNVTNPSDLLSSNPLKGSNSTQRKYVRQVTIAPVPNDSNARQVTVKVWYANASNTQPIDASKPLASITGILKTNVSNTPPTQVFDIFMISVSNAPGWWIDLADVRPMFETTLNDLEARNPGIQYRRHYITEIGYGRDPYYLPYINNVDDTDDQTLPWTYFYPGKIDQTNYSQVLDDSYVLENIKGRLREDHTKSSVLGTSPVTVNGRATSHHPIYKTSSYYDDDKVAQYLSDNPDIRYRKFALADRWNHVMRYPELKAMKQRLETEQNLEDASLPANLRRPPMEPSLAELLEDLNTNPDKYKNAIIVNLHGEMVPLPPLRNYSDPAKLPQDELPNATRDLNLPN
ncbi:MAG: prepilin-type N-terminal cleavage/methylation domain-containing protein, partial [Polynucleobacter sp.]|nr:prepilin-type N-terminal cleavage/methylation domain-containing protein [Polynucleobacter sp.]